jgi:predicted CoA-binding protein
MSPEAPVTLVLGASPKPDRYSNLCVRRLVQHGHAVIAVGRREGAIGEVPIVPAIPQGRPVDTVTMYLNRENQRPWEGLLLKLRPRRIIFNPGAENDELARRAGEAGIGTLVACTLVLLSTGQY